MQTTSKNPTSLLLPDDGNLPVDNALSDSESSHNETEGNNSPDPAQAIRDRIKKQLADAQKARAIAQKNPVPQVDEVAIAIHKRAIQRMQEFLLSGEPILMAEVGQWLVKQPQSVRDELTAVDDDDEQRLLHDLAKIAKQLVLTELSTYKVKSQLEERYGKVMILELTEKERNDWIRILTQGQPSDSS